MSVDPIVDEGVWQRAKDIKEARAPHGFISEPGHNRLKTLLTGLAVCGLCGAGWPWRPRKGANLPTITAQITSGGANRPAAANGFRPRRWNTPL